MTESAPARTIPPLRMRVAIALAIGLFCALLVVIGAEHALPTSDFDQCWVAARALLHGHNPYDMIGPGRAFAWRFPFFYPLPAALIAMPFAWFEVSVTRALFISISAALLAFAITRRDYHRLVLFLSAGFCVSLLKSQWEPLLTAAALLPALSWVFVAKPTVGAALFVAFPSRTAVLGGVALVAVSLIVMPSWPATWLQMLHQESHMRTPIITLMGPLLLLALLRWRRPEARLLVALACVPQTLILYMTVPLFLIPDTLGESALLAALSWVAQTVTFTMPHQPPHPSFYTDSAWVIVALMYIPCLVMVLRRRNEGELPAVVASLQARVSKRRRVVAAL